MGARNNQHFPYLPRYYFIVCLRNNGVFLENVMNELRSDNNLYISPLYSFWSRINDLARPAPLLTLLGSLREEKMLKRVIR